MIRRHVGFPSISESGRDFKHLRILGISIDLAALCITKLSKSRAFGGSRATRNSGNSGENINEYRYILGKFKHRILFSSYVFLGILTFII